MFPAFLRRQHMRMPVKQREEQQHNSSGWASFVFHQQNPTHETALFSKRKLSNLTVIMYKLM